MRDAGSPLPAPGDPVPYAVFGDNFVRMILHPDRVARSVDQVLGDELRLGPIGAGPGRRVARITALARFRPTTATEVAGGGPDAPLAYRVLLPLSVDFEIQVAVDVHRFHAEVQLPLLLRVETSWPLTLHWRITPPAEDEVVIEVGTDKRRSALLQRVSGLDAELRRFMTKVVAKELSKPHVRRATEIDMLTVIDGAWPAIAAQFLPAGPADRLGLPAAGGVPASAPGPGQVDDPDHLEDLPDDDPDELDDDLADDEGDHRGDDDRDEVGSDVLVDPAAAVVAVPTGPSVRLGVSGAARPRGR